MRIEICFLTISSCDVTSYHANMMFKNEPSRNIEQALSSLSAASHKQNIWYGHYTLYSLNIVYVFNILNKYFQLYLPFDLIFGAFITFGLVVNKLFLILIICCFDNNVYIFSLFIYVFLLFVYNISVTDLLIPYFVPYHIFYFIGGNIPSYSSRHVDWPLSKCTHFDIKAV